MEPMKPMQPMKPLEPMADGRSAKPWWPADLGEPVASGSANALRYAYFAERHRLAVDDGKAVRVYDTSGKRVGGFRSAGDGGLGFDTEDGPGDLAALKAV